MALSDSGSNFEPPGSEGIGDHIAALVRDVLFALGSAKRVVSAVRDLDPPDRRAARVGAVGVGGGAVAVVAGQLDFVALPFWAYVLFIGVFQVPWVRRAVPAASEDSARRRQIHEARSQELRDQARFKKTQRWRREWARSYVGSLPVPLECSSQVDEDMEQTVREVEDDLGVSLALILIKRHGDEVRVMLTKGDISDCLKVGTEWDFRDMDVYGYVGQRSLYPSHLIEREMLGGDEYFLMAASEIDVLGPLKEAVLDCFLDMIVHGIGPVKGHKNSQGRG